MDLKKLGEELDVILRAEKNGSLYAEAPFDILGSSERGIRDIAFSGDGEPTASPHFGEAVRIAARARLRFGLDAAKLVLLTNAACLNRPKVRAALAAMDKNNGEIWVKLDAGTESRFRSVNRPNVSLDCILGNILGAARIRPVVIQSLWFRIRGAAPPAGEIEAYCSRLNGMIAAGGRIKRLQLYTIARIPAEAHASPLSREELDRVAAAVKARVPVPVEVFHSGL